ncbi:MAG: alanine racemase, partial [Dehalococcoidia bacterium]|nr:alanine racemase [Dehalococcoidia bacterium]
ILLKINTGLDRVGVTAPEALPMARQIAALPGVELVGILTHEGQAMHERSLEGAQKAAWKAGETMVAIANELRDAGIDIKEVSVGSTATARAIAYVPGITEIRPGTYIFNDVNRISIGVATEDTCALTILATVVSIPADNRAILDAGSKTVTSDQLATPSNAGGYGYIKGYPDVRIDHLTEEHGILVLENARSTLTIGQQVEVIPNHVCPVVNLADVMYGMRNGVCEQQIEILCRGKNR